MTTDLSYYDTMGELLEINLPPFKKVRLKLPNGEPIDVGYTFDFEIEDELCRRVCQLLPELSPKDWPAMVDATGRFNEGHINERLIWMQRARDKKREARGQLPEDGAKVKPEDVPPEFREDKKPRGEILTSKYLINHPEWHFAYKKQFTEAYKDGKLNHRIKVGRPYAYLYDELSALWRVDSLKDDTT